MKILMIGAHQDDNEFRCGGLAHRLTKMGHEVRFLSCCNGCGGHHIMTPEETVKRRAGESAAVAELLGIQYDVWDIDDCTLVADLATRRKLIRYIREFAPDLVISHRQNDYHADHRAVGLLVQDASYMLTVPHECPDVAAMRRMPVIMYNEDGFRNPDFRADLVFDMDDEIETKLQIAHLNVSQVYEWLPYTHEEAVPEGEEARFAFLKGMEIMEDTTDEEVMAASRGYSVRFAKTAARFRKELIGQYGQMRGSKIRYAEAYEVCEYGAPLAGAVKEMLESVR
ncbi:MAG: PIG-L family deacetylase [Lachnospiraceae bacterium]|nr:PIG-L family deacetylase [Lachnospiraceae bacterium]MBR4060051.1 PIG-L family deacetylase [Lachnospiraceae bacterium]